MPDSSSSLPGTCARAAQFLLGLAPGGGCLAAALLRTPVGSYPTISPLQDPTARAEDPSGMFLWPDPAGNRQLRQPPPRVLPGAVLFGVRTFLDFARGEAAAARPTWGCFIILDSKAGVNQLKDILLKIQLDW